jgi:hypothetical protein
MSKPKRVKLYTVEDLSAWVFATFSNARSGVEIHMTLDRHFVGESRRGLPWECLLAKAINRAAINDPKLFPHPVKNAYVIGTTCYIIDWHPKRGNQVTHCVKYQHNFTPKLRKFDTWTKARFVAHFGDEGCTVRLRPPRTDPRRVHGERNATPSREDGSRSSRKLRGAERRAHDAGLVPPAAT